MACRTAPFAAEARSYGLLLGASALALLCWLRAFEKPTARRCLVLAASLCLVASTHYYAILVPLPLAVAQAFHDVRKRRISWPVWTAFCAAGLPLLAFLPVMRGSRALTHFWSPPTFNQLVETPMNMIGPELGAILAIALVVFLSLKPQPREIPVAPPEWIAIGGFIVLPLAGWLLAVFVTHAYVERYVPQPVIGLSVALAFGLGRRFASRGRIALLTAAAFCCTALALDGFRLRNARQERAQLQEIIHLVDSASSETLPVAFTAAETWLRLDYYYPSPAFTYLCDPDLTLRYEGQNMVEVQLRDHAGIFPKTLTMYGSFVASHPRFLLFAVHRYIPDWPSRELAARGWNLRMLGEIGAGTLYLADAPKIP
jgi:hypothetical protein